MATLTYDEELYLRKSLADLGTVVSESNLKYTQTTFVGDGIQTVFTLFHQPDPTFQIFVLLNGVLQKSPEIWSISGLVLTFINPPASGVQILVVYELV